MRVAILSGNAPVHNAVGNRVAEMARFFQERGWEMGVFVEDARRLQPQLRGCTHEVRMPKSDDPTFHYLRQADLILAIYGQYFGLLQYLPALAGAGPRIVLDYLGVTPPELCSDQQRAELEVSVRERGYAWCADQVLTMSQCMHAELTAATDFPAAHMSLLPPTVDIARFTPVPRDRYLQTRLGISGPVLLFVGRLAPNKRVPLLIEALAKRPDAHVVIVGDDSDVYAAEAECCRALADRLGACERVHWLGQLDDAALARVYRSADVLVMPSMHEGFCVPVIEAMASGLPVLTARNAALPETIADAGLTFAADDGCDLVRQLARVLEDRSHAEPHGRFRVAVVSFRFGPQIVGGAETSLRAMASSLQAAGHHVEVLTTCTLSESRWRNELPAGTVTLAGLTVHRFPIDAHEPAPHGEAVRAILEADGRVGTELERRYLETSIHSAALIDALRARASEFDAIIVGPYLFGLTADVLGAFAEKTLVAPCFHDEPIARLSLWPGLISSAGAILYHSAEEQAYAQATLGVNHPNARVLGAWLDMTAAEPSADRRRRPFVVYCGRYSAQKNVPTLLDWATRYQAERPGQLDFVFIGQGEIKLPAADWLQDRGRVDEASKRAILAGAAALVQLSTQESLSLVALEAWAQGTPIIAHRDCAVLAGQIERSGGGASVGDYAEFAGCLDDLVHDAHAWQQRGAAGRRYVEANYASPQAYASALIAAIEQLAVPMSRQMRERGLQRAAQFSRKRWQECFGELVERILTQPARARHDRLVVEPLRSAWRSAAGAATQLLPVRVRNLGTHAAVGVGPARSLLCWAIDGEPEALARDNASLAGASGSDACVGERGLGGALPLPALLLPGRTQTIALPVVMPADAGRYRLTLWMETAGQRGESAQLSLEIGTVSERIAAGCAEVFLDAVHDTLPATHKLAQLPADYVDVSEGRLAPVKRLVKKKLLNNFKHAYVDVLSRQQSQVNGQVVLMIEQLAECCGMLDRSIAHLHRRLDGLEEKIAQLAATPDHDAQQAVGS